MHRTAAFGHTADTASGCTAPRSDAPPLAKKARPRAMHHTAASSRTAQLPNAAGCASRRAPRLTVDPTHTFARDTPHDSLRLHHTATASRLTMLRDTLTPP